MKKYSYLLVICLSLFYVIAFTISPAFTAESVYTIGLSQRSIGGNVWWDAMINSIKSELEKLGGHKLIIIDAQEDIVKQNRDVENLISQKVDGIIVNPVTEIEIKPALEAAKEANIPVVVGNEKVADELLPYIITNVTLNDYRACFESGAELGRRFEMPADKDEIKVLIVAGTPDTMMSLNRRSGLIAGFAEQLLKKKGSCNLNFMGIRYAYYYPQKALEEVEPFLQAHPDIDVILSETDEHLRGFMSAVKSIGKAGQIQIASLDGIRESIEYIINGEVTCTAVNPPNLTGILLARAIIDAIEKKPMPSQTYVPTMVITKDNAEKYYDPERTYTDDLMFGEEYQF